MNIKNNKNQIGKTDPKLSLSEMIGRYTSVMPINCVELKQKLK